MNIPISDAGMLVKEGRKQFVLKKLAEKESLSEEDKETLGKRVKEKEALDALSNKRYGEDLKNIERAEMPYRKMQLAMHERRNQQSEAIHNLWSKP